MDMRMPEFDGIAATRESSPRRRNATRVLMLTTFDLDEYVYDALRAGASGFLLKDVPPINSPPASEWSPPGTRCWHRHHPPADRGVRTTPPAAPPPPDSTSSRHASSRYSARRARQVQRRDRRRADHRRGDREDTRHPHADEAGLRDRVQAVVLAYEAGGRYPQSPLTRIVT